jgi:hypothetical protein
MLHLHSEAEQIYQPEESMFLNQEINQSRQLKMAKIKKIEVPSFRFTFPMMQAVLV